MSIGQTVLNTLQVGALRMPVLFSATVGTLCVGEGMLRGITSVLSLFGFNGESTAVKKFEELTTFKNVSSKININCFRPFKDLTNQDLAKVAAVSCAVGILGSEFVSKVFGPAPAIYNTVLSYMGPIRISTDTHPVIQMVTQYITGR